MLLVEFDNSIAKARKSEIWKTATALMKSTCFRRFRDSSIETEGTEEAMAARKPKAIQPEPHISAAEAGLRYVSDMTPGIRRKKSGKSFRYVDPAGNPLKNADHLARIRKLAIPPAYTDVWICPDPRGHIQATGRDARGRKQYRYHPRWREIRDETKFTRLLAFAEVLPRMREAVERDLNLSGLPRNKVLATVVRLLEWTCIRVGNEEYARNNKSFGLTTLKNKHVEVSGSRIRFEFQGKSGKAHSCDISDRRLARIVARCQAIPGQELFQYIEEDGSRQAISSEDVNGYIREIAGDDFSAKDFRTWTGTMLAAAALREQGPATTEKEAKAAILKAIDQVSVQLNNTRAVCRKYYVHPALFESYSRGTLLARYERELKRARATGLENEEAAVLAILRAQLRLAA
jgi:DNA topoisomerase-1